jgi:hypothetical protein
MSISFSVLSLILPPDYHQGFQEDNGFLSIQGWRSFDEDEWCSVGANAWCTFGEEFWRTVAEELWCTMAEVC